MDRVTIRKSLSFLAIALLFAGGHDAIGALVTSDPGIPPEAPYFNPNNNSITYVTTTGIVTLSDFQITPSWIGPPTHGPGDEFRIFLVTLIGNLTINTTTSPFSDTGIANTIAYSKGPSDPTGMFDTEMLGLLLGSSGVHIRENPALTSLGETTITNIGGGMYHIDSFFDVFTELSLDGGNTWFPSSGSTLITVVPESRYIYLLAAAMFLSMAQVARVRARHAASI